MTLTQYQRSLDGLPFGKRLPTAHYVFRGDNIDLGEELNQLVSQIVTAFQVGTEFNLIKFRTDVLKVSFLEYPEFIDDPHPALRKAITIDLVNGKAREINYSGNHNPPILHRKESFLPQNHPSREEFEKLTKEEESAGLFEHPATIGFKLNWKKELVKKGVLIQGHSLHRVSSDDRVSLSKPIVDRHKTAMARHELSKPVKSLMEHGLLKPTDTFFDVGCGQGADFRGLQALGYRAEGWDPVYRPEVGRKEADVVNFGYVLNVIEDPAERLEALVDAFRTARRLLVVSALIQQTVEVQSADRFRDGILTKRNTFQKYFEQQELQQYIEDALDCTAIPAALGVFFVFRCVADQQDFLSSRNKRTLDWTQINSRLGLGQPKPRISLEEKREKLYQENRDLFEAYWQTMLQLGRRPETGEFARETEIRDKIGSLRWTEQFLVERYGEMAWAKAREMRRNDLTVYLAQASFQKRIPFQRLSPPLRYDIRSHFGNYGHALKLATELLFASGDPGEIEVACEGLAIGWQDEQALFIHSGLLDQLPPILRVYVGCGLRLYGDEQESDVIKIHKASGKVTFLIYEDFAGKPLPQLLQRIKVDLRKLRVQVFDHSAEGQLLYFKERFLDPDHPGRASMDQLSQKIRQLGITEDMSTGLRKADLAQILKERNLQIFF